MKWRRVVQHLLTFNRQGRHRLWIMKLRRLGLGARRDRRTRAHNGRSERARLVVDRLLLLLLLLHADDTR